MIFGRKLDFANISLFKVILNFLIMNSGGLKSKIKYKVDYINSHKKLGV